MKKEWRDGNPIGGRNENGLNLLLPVGKEKIIQNETQLQE